MNVDAHPYPYEIADPFSLPAQIGWLRAHEPVRKVKVATGDDVWLITRHEDCRTALADRRLSRNVFRPDTARLLPDVPVVQVSKAYTDDVAAHTRWRRLVSKAFTARHVEGMRPQVQALVDELLDAMEATGQPADLMTAFAYPLSSAVLCGLLGISTDEHDRFRELADVALTINDKPMDEKMATYQKMVVFSQGLVAAKRAEPAEDLLSRLIAAVDGDDGALSEEELVSTILAMFIGGYESTVNQIGKGMLALFRHPEQLAMLRADPSMVDSAVEETLRYASVDIGFGSPRYATDDVEVGGVTIPKGSTVLVVRMSGNRDEARFPDPDRFDITREPRQHFAFGFGPHNCLGAALARLELQLGTATLLRRFPELRLTVPADEVKWDFRVTAAGPAALPVAW